jgi:hypothetical protein
MAVTVISRALVGSCPQVSGTWHIGECRGAWRHDIDADTSCADQRDARIWFGSRRGQLPHPGKAAGTRADVGLRTIWRNPVCRTLSSSLPVFLLLIGCATGIGVFINAGETMIETGYLDSESEIVTANALRGATLQSLQLIAPLIAGTLLALVAPRMLIVIAAITSIIPLLVFARLPLEVRTDEQTGTSATTLPALLSAIRGHVAHDRDLQIFFSVQAIVMIVLGMQGPLIFTYIIEERGFEVPQFAFLMAALGAGALLSAGLFIWTSMRLSLTLIMALLILDGVALLPFVLTDIPALIFGFMAAMDLIGGVYMIVMRSFLQSRSEADGRDKLIAAFYGIQEPFLMMGLVFLLLILPFFTASQILFGASLVEIGLSAALLLAESKNPARL